jgi:hypothetical protein
MITKFEEYAKPQIGDYVQIKTLSTDTYFREFVNNSIGELIDFKTYGLASEYNIDVIVKYDDIPKHLKNWFSHNNTRQFGMIQIDAFGKTKEDVEIQMQAKNYNI